MALGLVYCLGRRQFSTLLRGWYITSKLLSRIEVTQLTGLFSTTRSRVHVSAMTMLCGGSYGVGDEGEMVSTVYCLDNGSDLQFFALDKDDIFPSQRFFKFDNLSKDCRCFAAALPTQHSRGKSASFAFEFATFQQELLATGKVRHVWPIHKLNLPHYTAIQSAIDNRNGIRYYGGLLVGLADPESLSAITSCCRRHNLRVDFEVQVKASLGNGAPEVFKETVSTVSEVGGQAAIVVPLTVQRPEGEKAGTHPAFSSRNSNSLFHSLEEVLAALIECPVDKSGIRELQDIANSRLVPVNLNTTVTKYPLVVVEGLDATGKSTLVDNLVSRLGAVQMGTPPPYLTHLRPLFDSHPTLVRRIFYSIGNYLASQDIQERTLDRPVVMDRFWHSTAAYTIATECGSGSVLTLPDAGHYIYTWPLDLVRPTLVILLTVSDQVRRSRLLARVKDIGTEITEEERKLDASLPFQQRIISAYRNMIGIPIEEISADGSREEVLEKATQVLHKHNILQQSNGYPNSLSTQCTPTLQQ